MENNQPQYFTPGLPPEPPKKWFQVRRNQIMLGGGVVVGVAVIVLVVIFILNSIHATRPNSLANVKDRIEQAVADCSQEKDPAACASRTQAELARAAATPAACQGLTDAAYSNCVGLIARDTKDIKVCSALTDDTKTSCQDAIVLLQATSAQDYKLCSALHDVTKQASCQAQILPSILAAGECSTYDIPQDQCDQQSALDAAIVAGNPAGCDTLQANFAASCHDIFSSIDADHDGLSLAEESKYGTSDQQADTDGDGYDDGVEVANGHDPLKP